MGRKYFTFDWNRGDNFEEHAWKVQQEGVNREGADRTVSEAQIVGDKRRVRQKDAAIGLDTRDVHHRGDKVVISDEVPEIKGGKRTGDVLSYGHRYSDSGKLLETREYRWIKVGDGKHVLAGSRRVSY